MEADIRGGTIQFDEVDAPLVLGHRWCVVNGYAARGVRNGHRRTTQYLHRLIVNAPSGYEVDHINGDRLDNRRANLRLVTRSQNEQNKHFARSDSRTGIRGVSWSERDRHFIATVWSGHKRLHCSYHRSIDEAASAVAAARAVLMPYSPESRARR